MDRRVQPCKGERKAQPGKSDSSIPTHSLQSVFMLSAPLAPIASAKTSGHPHSLMVPSLKSEFSAFTPYPSLHTVKRLVVATSVLLLLTRGWLVSGPGPLSRFEDSQP